MIVLVGNKFDLDNERRITKEDLEDKADEHSIHCFFEVSALTKHRGTINDMFDAIINNLETMSTDPTRGSFKLAK